MIEDTIFALASGAGKAGIAVYRISGPNASQVILDLCDQALPVERQAVRAALKDRNDDVVIDDGLALWFPGPRSFTGEDVVELHLHGGWAVTSAVLENLGSADFLRIAEPGEFTRRAFENGKMDLTAAEGLADLINAETEAQRLQSQRQMNGELGEIYQKWRQRLMHASALFEAEIDFSDEDLPGDLRTKVDNEVNQLANDIKFHLDDGGQGQIVRDGFYITIVGPPNAGKSSLLNIISKKKAAIVSEEAGTTRDVIEVHLDIKVFPVILADTAGLREPENMVELEGIRRAKDRAKSADLIVAVHDGSHWPQRDSYMDGLSDSHTIHLVNKVDLLEVTRKTAMEGSYLGVSALTGQGLDLLMARLKEEISERCHLSATPAITKKRHRQALEESLHCLVRYQDAGESELKAEDLRLAVRALGRITGQVGVEDILDIIFSEFCIGK